MKHLLLILLLFLVSEQSVAQKKNAAYRLLIRETLVAPRIDGVLNDAAWQEAEMTGKFFMALPMDTSFATVPTEVRMSYDRHHLYIIAVCHKTVAGPNMVESLRRDFAFQKNDNFIFFIDPFDDQTNGFTFGANAAGAQWDGTLFEGGKADLNWDNKWESVVTDDPEKWVFEAAIPFTTIRFKKGISEWGINFSRNDLKTTEKSSWAPVPRQFPTASLAYTGTLVWDKPPPIPGKNISFIPYVLSSIGKDYESSKATAFRRELGLDAKIAVTSSLNLDLTIHPDFSQVEVDKQVTNLSRFELFFPERRQFFLENNDLFTNFGFANIRPFFSRRIGLGVPIDFGARLSGKLDKNWRLGVLDVKTAAVKETGLPAQNFAVFTLQRKLFRRSNIGFIYVDKTSLNYSPGADSGKAVYAKYNRNIGMEYNLASSNNLWTGKAFLMRSFRDGAASNSYTHAASLLYNSRRWNISWQHEYVGKDFTAEAGYVPRRGYVKLNPQASLFLFPKAGSVLSHGPQLNASSYFNERFRHTDHETVASYLVTFRNRVSLSASYTHDDVVLLQPFDPTNTGKDSLPVAGRHSWNTAGFDLVSQPQQLLTYAFSVRYGGYFADGMRLGMTGEIGYRFQPYVSLSLNTSFNRLQLPKPWGNTVFLLAGPRVDVTLSNTLFFTAYLQYNDQQRNVNFNTRLQWRYKPASDLFLVYTDNYVPSPFAVKNRALVLKLNYWWNL